MPILMPRTSHPAGVGWRFFHDVAGVLAEGNNWIGERDVDVFVVVAMKRRRLAVTQESFAV